MVGDFIFDSSNFLQFCAKRSEIASLDIDTDIGDSLRVVEEVCIWSQEIAEIISRPITSSDADQMIVNSFHEKRAESREHIAGREVTSGPEKDKCFHIWII